jgi:twitching motility protein PilT
VSPSDLAIDALLGRSVELGASDLHVTAGVAPSVRIHGSLGPLPGFGVLTPADTAALARSVVTDEQWKRFEYENELDTAYTLPGVSRFRVNVYRQRGSVGAAFRTIPHHIRSLADLGMPASIERFAHLPRGLVLVTGPTGSGKSTTLAALLDVANQTRSGHIVTIEDPIEYLHAHGGCVVNQREVGSDTADFAVALRHVLRQDPDIILVGELRDLETTSVAVTAAETGHLVLATLHTQSAGCGHAGARPDHRRRRADRRMRDHGRDVGDPEPHPRREGAPDSELPPVLVRRWNDQLRPAPCHALRTAADK